MSERNDISEAELRTALFQGVTRSAAGPAVPLALDSGFALRSALDELSRQYIQVALKLANHNKNSAAKLGLNSHQVLTTRVKKLGLKESLG